MVDQEQSKISWKLTQIARTKWPSNLDYTVEHPITFRASMALNELLDGMSPILHACCPQDIEDLNVVDKTNGEISLQWHGPVFELDIDVEASGKVSFLLCPTGSTEDRWISRESVEVKELLGFVQVLASPNWW